MEGQQPILLSILHYENLGQSPMVLQDMPRRLRKQMPAEQYRALKQKVDNALLPVFVIARRLRVLSWCSGAVLLISLVGCLVLLLVHVYEDSGDLVGFMLPALCPAGGVAAHLLFHRYRRQKMSSVFKAMEAHLRGVLKWESEKFLRYNFRLRCDSKDERFGNFAIMHIAVTVFSSEEIMERSIPPSPCEEGPAPMAESPIRSPNIHASTPALDPPFVDITQSRGISSQSHIELLDPPFVDNYSRGISSQSHIEEL